jgi:hypothetical protein
MRWFPSLLIAALSVGAIGCRIDFGTHDPVGPVDPTSPDNPSPIVRPVTQFNAAEFSAAIADEAAFASTDSANSEKGSEIVSGTLRQYERIWPSKLFDDYQDRLLKAVPAIELSGGKARDLTAVEIAQVRAAR